MLAWPAAFLASVYPSRAGLEGSGGVLSGHNLAPQVLIPVAFVWIISALLRLSVSPLELSASPKAPWVWLPHPGSFALRPSSSYPSQRSVSLNSRFREFHF